MEDDNESPSSKYHLEDGSVQTISFTLRVRGDNSTATNDDVASRFCFVAWCNAFVVGVSVYVNASRSEYVEFESAK